MQQNQIDNKMTKAHANDTVTPENSANTEVLKRSKGSNAIKIHTSRIFSRYIRKAKNYMRLVRLVSNTDLASSKHQ